MEPNKDSATDRALPALRRNLEVMPIQHEGKPMFMIQDMEGICAKPVVMSAGSILIASLLTGTATATEIRSLFTKHTGNILGDAEIKKLVKDLDDLQLLETPKVQAKRKKILEDFMAGSTRKAMLKGIMYPENTIELSSYMGKFLQDPKGPKKPLAEKAIHDKAPLGLISPHIDISRGGPVYAWAYQALSEYKPPDTIIALGVAHTAPNSPWAMTTKSYETPFGPMETDQELYAEIEKTLWYDPKDDEWTHRQEHSLELQALWLKFLWKDKAPKWVPILCSAFERFCPDKSPSTVPTVEGAIKKISAILEKRTQAGQNIMVLAAVDLAHVGPRFGDQAQGVQDKIAKIEAEDRKSMDHVTRLEPDEFYLSAAKDQHWRRVCGLSALYTSIRLIKALNNNKAAQGKVLAYGQAADPMGGAVSMASAIITKS
ncbi:AmmeMemoRadiSam system protein B [Elusimicrobiota bacterium]